MTEKELLSCVIQMAHVFGWKVAHFRPGLDRKGNWKTAVQGDGVGFPDLIMVRGSVIFAVELKTEKASLTNEQVDWLRRISAGAYAHVWRPSQWKAGTIEKLLRG